MATDQPLIGHYLEEKIEMTKEELDAHYKFIKSELSKLEKEYLHNNKVPKRETVTGVAFSPLPVSRHRLIEPDDHKVILDYKTGYSLADEKKDFPSIFDNEFAFGIKTTKREFYGAIYKRYKWNNADIVGIIQIVALCSKDDRRIVLASGLHDFLLEYKYELFNNWYKEDPSLTIDEFRWITIDAFRWVCQQQGFTAFKAKLMSNVLDNFQKHFQKSRWKIEVEE